MQYGSMRNVTPFIVLLFAGCASGGSEFGVVETSRTGAGFDQQTMDLNVETQVRRDEFDAPVDRVFSTTLAVVQALGLPVQSSVPPQGVAVFNVQSTRLRIADQRPANYINCGGGPAGPRANNYRITLTVTTRVARVNERTRLETVLAATARDPGKSSAEITCTTTGLLERMIAQDVAERVVLPPTGETTRETLPLEAANDDDAEGVPADRRI